MTFTHLNELNRLPIIVHGRIIFQIWEKISDSQLIDALFIEEIPEVAAAMILLAHKLCRYCFLRFFASSSSAGGVFCCFLFRFNGLRQGMIPV